MRSDASLRTEVETEPQFDSTPENGSPDSFLLSLKLKLGHLINTKKHRWETKVIFT